MASEEDSSSSLTCKGTPVSELRVIDIKRELDERGLSKSGSKTQLTERLKAQLLLEKLQQDAAQSSGDELEGKAPNMALQDDKAGQNEFVRLYLQQQQRNIEIQMEVKKQVEEERKRKSADESSADETNLLGEDARPTPAEADLTSPKKFKDEKLNAPVKEGRMPRVARKSSRHASKGENGQEEAVPKDSRPSTPENESIRDRTRSGSSSSDRSPAPEKSRRGRRGRQPRGRASRGARRGGISKKESRSSSPSSSPEELQPKRKRHSTNSLSSGSRSCSPPQPPDTGTRRSSRRAAVRLTPEQTPEADVEEDKEKGRPQRKRWTRKSSSQETAVKVQNTGIMEESVKLEISKISEASNLLQKETDFTKEENVDKVAAVRIEEDNDSGQRISPTEKNIAFDKQKSEVPEENVPSKSENHDKMDKAPEKLEVSSYLVQKDQQQSFLKDVSSTENDEIKKESQTNRIVTPRDISGDKAKSPETTEDLEAKASTSRLVRWKSSRNKSCTPQADEAKSKDSESVKITDKRKPPREPKSETKESIVNSLPSLPLKSDDIKINKVIKLGNTMKNIDEMNYSSETGPGKEAQTEGKSSDEAKGDRQKTDAGPVILDDEVVTRDADIRTCKAIGASRVKEDDEAMPQDRLARRLGALTEHISGSSSSDSDSNDDSKSSSSSSSRSGSVSSSSKDSHKKAKARLCPENGTSNQKSSEHSPRLSDYPNTIEEKIKSHAMLKGELHPELPFPQRPEHGSPPNKADDGREKVKEAKSSTAAENKDSLVQREEVDDNLRKEKMSKKRKWGSKTSKATKVMKKPANMEISSDSLKGLIGEVKIAETVFDMETEVVNTLDYDEQEEDRRDIRLKRTVIQSSSQSEEELEAIGEEEKSETEEDARLVEPRDEALEKKSLSPESIPEEPEKKLIKLTSTVPKEGKKKVKESKKVKMKKVVSPLHSKEIVKEKIEAETKEKIIAVRRPSKPVIQQVDDPEPVLEKQTSARNHVSRVLRIVGLVRPFTLNQLKELLKRTGELEEESFWINNIKSECLVTYKMQEEAEITRNALHGTKWPSSNPKILDVDYSTISDVKHRQNGSSGPLPSAQKIKEEAAPRQSDRDRKEEEERERRQKARDQREKEREERDKELKDKRETEKQKRREAGRHTNIREWDRDKIQQLSRSRSRSKGRDNERSSRRSRDRERERDDRKRHDRSHDKDEEKKKEKKQKADEEPPAKLLDDLFRKTKSTPCIYWLPLTEEQAQQRLVQKEEREKERQKRLAAIEERNREEQKKREAARLERQRDRQRERSRERLDKERDTGKGREGGMKGKNRGRSLGSRSRSRSRDRRRR